MTAKKVIIGAIMGLPRRLVPSNVTHRRQVSTSFAENLDVEKIAWPTFQARSQREYRLQPGVSLPAFNATDIVAVKACPFRKLLLA